MYSTKQVAEMIGVSMVRVFYIMQEYKKKKIKFGKKIGHSYVFTDEDIEKLKADRRESKRLTRNKS